MLKRNEFQELLRSRGWKPWEDDPKRWTVMFKGRGNLSIIFKMDIAFITLMDDNGCICLTGYYSMGCLSLGTDLAMAGGKPMMDDTMASTLLQLQAYTELDAIGLQNKEE